MQEGTCGPSTRREMGQAAGEMSTVSPTLDSGIHFRAIEEGRAAGEHRPRREAASVECEAGVDLCTRVPTPLCSPPLNIPIRLIA